jgi:2-polyprenyl-3-methyl-5-hydroxy-6-metoxy-1,4-benzoquinol methylase
LEKISTSKALKLMDAVFAFSRPFRLGPYLRRKRFSMVGRYARGKVLDVGCGLGEMARYLIEIHSMDYIGIDNNRDVIENGKLKNPSLMLHAVDIDNEDLPPKLSTLTFDTVTFVAVMEHLKYPSSVIKKVSGRMNNNSRIIVTVATPSGERIFNILAIFGFTNRSAIAEHESASQSSWTYKQLYDLIIPLGYELEYNKKFEFGLNQIIVFRKALQ